MTGDHPVALLEERRQKAAGPLSGDLQRQTSHQGAQGARPVAVAVAELLLAAPVAVHSEEGGKLQRDQLLQAVACPLGISFPALLPSRSETSPPPLAMPACAATHDQAARAKGGDTGQLPAPRAKSVSQRGAHNPPNPARFCGNRAMSGSS